MSKHIDKRYMYNLPSGSSCTSLQVDTQRWDTDVEARSSMS